MAMKSAAVLHRFTRNATLKALSRQRVFDMDRLYGTATGLVVADEGLPASPLAPEASRKSPSRGTELCAIVESMFSYSEMFSVFGDVAYADRVERIAFNALQVGIVAVPHARVCVPVCACVRVCVRECAYYLGDTHFRSFWNLSP